MEQDFSVKQRRRLSRAEVAGFIEQYSATGLTQKDFAASINIGYSTFTGWLRRHRRLTTAVGSMPGRFPFVAVDVAKPIPPEGSAPYQVECPNGMRLAIRPGFDAMELAHLLKVLRACSP